GNDGIYLSGESLNNTVYCGSGNDTIDATSTVGTNFLYGGAGNDTLLGGSGKNHIDGGAGTNMAGINLSAYNSSLNFTFHPTATNTLPNNTVVNCQGLDLSLGNGNDTLNYSNALIGSDVTLGNGNDKFTSGAVQDTVSFGSGKGTFIGDIGDTVTFGGGTASATMSYAAGGAVGGFVDGGTGVSSLTINMSNWDAADNGGLGGNDSLTWKGGTLFNWDSITNLTLTFGAGNDGIYLGGESLNNTVYCGSGNDTINVSASAGTNFLYGGAGYDTFVLGGVFKASDIINGEAASATVMLNGNYSTDIKFSATTMLNVGTIDLAAGNDYNLTINAATVGAGQTLTVNGSGLDAGDALTFNGSADSNGTLILMGGAGTDTLIGGTYKDTFEVSGGGDTLVSSGGIDTFVYNTASDSTSTGYDTIKGFNAATDFFQLTFAVTGINAAVTGGPLSTLHFDQNLTHDIGASQLSAYHAVLFTPSSGNLSGDTFLIIDVNGVAGYQAGQDLVIELTNATDLANLSTSNFVT
ncbi:MAG: calcium-binding protein, partial [Rhizomicrobium sp.]